MILAPGLHDEAPAGQKAAHGEFADDARDFDLRRGAVESAVGEEESGEQPGDRDETVVNALEGFDFGVAESAAFDPNGEAEGEEEEDADEDEDAVEFERGVAARGDDEGHGAQQEDGGAVEESFAEGEFGGSGAEATGGADVGVAIGTAVEAASHEWRAAPLECGKCDATQAAAECQRGVTSVR